MCCAPSGFLKSEINGECSSCGEPTVDGYAYEACEYSPIVCEECKHAPCDQSC